MKQQFIPITKKARYFNLGDPESDKLLFVLHGYGNLAEYFIKKFEILADAGYYIIAPEGLHRFYLNGTSGRVGASWMTKELRELDIEENITYLDSLAGEITSKKNYGSISILGFSQGGATAARWKAKSEMELASFILWACVFPEDVRFDFQSLNQGKTKNQFVVGDEDEFFQGKQKEELIHFYRALDFSITTYKGKHAIDQNTLSLLLI